MSLLAELTEKLARPGLLGLAGRAIEKRCREDLENYFKHLAREILALNIQSVVEHATKEVALHAVKLKLSNVLRHRRPVLQAILESNLAEAMLKGDKVHSFTEAENSDDPPEDSAPGLSAQAAADWAKQHAGELVTGIDQTTERLISDAVGYGIEQELGVDGTGRLLRQLLNDMTAERSRTIALTEMNGAMSEAALQKLLRLGIEYKRWILSPGACPICEDNEAQGPIPVDDSFDSGDDRPPAHPNCRCAVVGARPPDEEAA